MSELDPEYGAIVTIGGRYYSRYHPSRDTKKFWDGAEKGELLIKHCQCGVFVHPSRVSCPRCSSMKLEWTRASGRGEVYTFSVIYHPYIPDLKDKVPYVIALVRLDEGVYFYTTIVGCEPNQVRIGTRVEVTFDKDNLFAQSLPKFRPSEGLFGSS